MDKDKSSVEVYIETMQDEELEDLSSIFLSSGEGEDVHPVEIFLIKERQSRIEYDE